MTIPSSIFYVIIYVYCNAKYGGTPGKLIVGIRITKPNGTPIGYKESWKRSSIDIIFALIYLVVELTTLIKVDPEIFIFSSWAEMTLSLSKLYPSWFDYINAAQQIWMWSEIFVLLFNKRKRALHDFIAGTIVINKEFVEQSN